jgi:hypothetical protein
LSSLGKTASFSILLGEPRMGKPPFEPTVADDPEKKVP